MALLSGWAGALFGLVPWLIRQAYAGESLPVLNGLISGQAEFPVEHYLSLWLRFAIGAAVLGTSVVVSAWWAWLHPQRAREARDRVFRAEPALSSASALANALWMGAVLGLLEAGLWWVRIRADGVFSSGSDSDTLWLSPTIQAGFFAVCVGLLLLLVGGRPRRLSLRTVIVMTATIGIWSALSRLRLGLHPLATFVLCLGFGAQLGRIAARDHPGFRSLVRRSWPFVVATVLTAFVVQHTLQERRMAASLAALPAAPAGAPNILLIVLDTVRQRSLSLYGYARPTTPHLEGLARRSLVFDQAIASAPWTLPSHASLFTGRTPFELSANWETPLDARFPTLAEYLSERGWATGGFVANYAYTTRASGLDRGFGTYRDYELKPARMLRASVALRRLGQVLPIRRRWVSPSRKFAASVNGELLDWVDDLEGRPWFAFLNY